MVKVVKECRTSGGSEDGKGRGCGGMLCVGDSWCVIDGTEDDSDIGGDSFVDNYGGSYDGDWVEKFLGRCRISEDVEDDNVSTISSTYNNI